MLDKNNLPYAIGKNISIVFTHYMVKMADYNYLSTGAAGYAGMISTLPLDQSSTNQPIAIPDPVFYLTNYQLGALTQAGIVTTKQSLTRGIVVTDGITQAPVSSVFRRLSAWRIGGAVEDVIRMASEPFVGKMNNASNRNSLKTAIKSGMEKLVGRLIESYDFNIIVDQKTMKFSVLNVDYSIVPLYEIREIHNRVTIKNQ